MDAREFEEYTNRLQTGYSEAAQKFWREAEARERRRRDHTPPPFTEYRPRREGDGGDGKPLKPAVLAPSRKKYEALLGMYPAPPYEDFALMDADTQRETVQALLWLREKEREWGPPRTREEAEGYVRRGTAEREKAAVKEQRNEDKARARAQREEDKERERMEQEEAAARERAAASRARARELADEDGAWE
ncbi:hypothetical protein BST28_17515 [Mycolicibacter kumamotonensis]|uniref:Uncharacterized protein n=1 Tax=Mycolicibacter kumamotonensis TaxID=354243 RepID=A0A1X0DZ98_9MYCO|nr:hypothetical protein [Mycolicibacter kumamotonensis]ORA77601.1 hypothetical protein BST28_17515 [Mycolicibacter kumamotonensis]